ncbi:MAG: folylpolyglutamate synthase/dihydrofolate synthase family protein [Pseudomonadota bacterium]
MSASADRLARALSTLKGHYPEEIELSLGRIERLLNGLGNPHHHLPPVIHVAGTNGKGSTCAFLRAMAEAAGLRVHVFTSPHLVRFNERVRLAGDLISDEGFAIVLERVKASLGTAQITHFEATTAAALLAFSEVPADLLVLEVGLGGRFDATNVILSPAVSVICPVDIDHKQFLGDTLDAIAAEKAGIIRPGVPVVSAAQRPEAARVIADEAEAQGAPLHGIDRKDFDAIPHRLSLKGTHQRANAALAAKALKTWGDLRISDQAVLSGAARADWPARLQRLPSGPITDRAQGAEVWLDGGHNPHAAKAVAEVLGQMPGRLALVTAMMASKDAQGFFKPFASLEPDLFTCPNSEGHLGKTPEDLVDAAWSAGFSRAWSFGCFSSAFEAAARSGADRILICGSLYLAGDVLALNLTPPR